MASLIASSRARRALFNRPQVATKTGQRATAIGGYLSAIVYPHVDKKDRFGFGFNHFGTPKPFFVTDDFATAGVILGRISQTHTRQCVSAGVLCQRFLLHIA